jgi:uncharacterized membrane-anchored protein
MLKQYMYLSEYYNQRQARRERFWKWVLIIVAIGCFLWVARGEYLIHFQ